MISAPRLKFNVSPLENAAMAIRKTLLWSSEDRNSGCSRDQWRTFAGALSGAGDTLTNRKPGNGRRSNRLRCPIPALAAGFAGASDFAKKTIV